MAPLADHLGFTGSRKGMTGVQRSMVYQLLEARPPRWVHHGLCVGADEQLHTIALKLGIPIEGHPPTDPRLRVWLTCDRLNPPVAYLRRNRAIVEVCAELLAAPAGEAEELRSGTWSTVRLARSLRRMVTVIWPDGSLEFDR